MQKMKNKSSKEEVLFISKSRINTICPARKKGKGAIMDETKCEHPRYIKNGVSVMTKRGVGYSGDKISLRGKKYIVIEGEG